MSLSAPSRPKNTHIFAQAEGLHYVEPEWLSVRLFEAEHFPGPIWDPFAGWGRIAEAARAAGYSVRATDIADRGYPHLDEIKDFLTVDHIDRDVSIVGNPPFDDEIVRHAIALDPVKMALIWPLARVVAAWSWLMDAPLARILLLTPRPPLPPGDYIAAGKKPEGARVAHCWLVFERDYRGPPQLGWLHRDRGIIGRIGSSTTTAPSNSPVVAAEPAAITGSVVTAEPAKPAHSPFGGSVAGRVLQCPASVDLSRKVPAYLHRPSAYADRGTALHAAITSLHAEDAHADVGLLAGKTFGNYTVTHEDVETTLTPVYAHIETLLDTPGAVYFLEQRVTFPTIPGTWGTVDILIRIGRTVHVTEFKFGVAVRVLALTPDGDEDVINAQLLFYAAAARHSLPDFFAGIDNIVLTILQPVSIDSEMVSSVTVTHAELDEFIAAYGAACAEARTPTPRLQPGSWCRFCPARPICPAHTGPLLDLAAFAPPAAETAMPKEAYLQLLAGGLNLVDAVKDIRAALHDQAKRALQNGDDVPGYALSAGRAERHWRDEVVAAFVALLGIGLDHDDIMESEALRSPKQIELRAKARGLEIPKELIDSRRSGVSLVRSENAHDPVLGRVELARLFSEALKTFQEGR